MGSHARGMLGSVLLVVTLASVAAAQWSDDPNQNLAIGDRTGQQAQPKIRATSDGGCYVSWFDNSAGGYDVYLQRLDAQGYEQWPHNGILIADRSLSWIQDYGLDVDVADNAVLAFRDDRSGADQITAPSVSTDGTLLWGPKGVQVSGQTDDVLSPRIAATSDGGCVVGWTRVEGADEKVIVELQKLDADGAALWGPGISLADEQGLSFMLSDLQASDAGGVVVSWVRQGLDLYPRHLWAQKLSSSGTLLWGSSHVVVFDAESLQAGNFPTFVPDGSGGAVFAWYFITCYSTDCAAQRILADGSEWLPHNGLTGSTAPRDRTCPGVSFKPATEGIFLFWEEELPGQPPYQYAVYGQKLTADHGRQWTDQGRIVTPFSVGEKGPIRSLPYADGSAVFFNAALAGGDGLQAARLSTDGDLVWSPPITFTGSSSPWRLEVALRSDTVALLAWTDGQTVYGQNVNPDGTLGPGQPVPIPTVSEWGMATMTLLLLSAGTLVFRRRLPRRG